ATAPAFLVAAGAVRVTVAGGFTGAPGPTRWNVIFKIFGGTFGLSLPSRGRRAIFSTTSCPSTTCANTVCSPFKCGVGASVMKNWQLPVFGAEDFAIPNLPGASKDNEGSN